MTYQNISGGCYCKNVRYELLKAPSLSCVCYCDDCRKVVGASSVAWICIPSSHFSYTKGLPQHFESSPNVIRSFCGNCGTSLTYIQKNKPEEMIITTVSLDDPNLFPPEGILCPSRRVRWDSILNLKVLYDPE